MRAAIRCPEETQPILPRPDGSRRKDLHQMFDRQDTSAHKSTTTAASLRCLSLSQPDEALTPLRDLTIRYLPFDVVPCLNQIEHKIRCPSHVMNVAV